MRGASPSTNEGGTCLIQPRPCCEHMIIFLRSHPKHPASSIQRPAASRDGQDLSSDAVVTLRSIKASAAMHRYEIWSRCGMGDWLGGALGRSGATLGPPAAFCEASAADSANQSDAPSGNVGHVEVLSHVLLVSPVSVLVLQLHRARTCRSRPPPPPHRNRYRKGLGTPAATLASGWRACGKIMPGLIGPWHGQSLPRRGRVIVQRT